MKVSKWLAQRTDDPPRWRRLTALVLPLVMGDAMAGRRGIVAGLLYGLPFAVMALSELRRHSGIVSFIHRHRWADAAFAVWLFSCSAAFFVRHLSWWWCVGVGLGCGALLTAIGAARRTRRTAPTAD